MLCKKCKKELQEDWLYCPWCGLNAKKDSRRAISQRKDGTYQKAITIDGKRKYFYGRSEKDVIKKIAEFSREAGDKRSAAFAVYAEALEQSWGNLAYNSLRGYKPALVRCVTTFGKTPVADITPMQVKGFLDKVGKTFSQKTVNTQKNITSQVFDLAILAGDIQVNPVANIKATGKKTSGREEASQEDREKIAAHWDDCAVSRLGYFIMLTGLRVGEALALRYEDIDRDKNQIHVTKSVYYVGTAPHIKEPKTDAGVRTVFLLPDVAERFTGKNGYIFTNEKGEILRSNESSRNWRKWCKNYGICCTFHQLRHSFATSCCEVGIDKAVIQGMMGHSSYIVTEKYTHLRDKMLEDAQAKFTTSLLHHTDANTKQ
jgi:integrase